MQRCIAALLWLAAAGASAAPQWEVEFLGQQQLPSGTRFADTELGGLSGLEFDPRSGRWRAISDDRAEQGPARFYELSLDLKRFERGADAGRAAVTLHGVTELRDVGGAPFARGGVDPEAIRVRGDRLYWASEGERSGALRIDPFVRQAGLDGTPQRRFELPAYYGTAIDGIGTRRNLGFESLALSEDGQRLYAATENALLQDGPAAGPGRRSTSRILVLDTARGAAVAEHLYLGDEPQPVLLGGSDNGLVELLHVPGRPDQLLALERAFASGPGVRARLYRVDLQGAVNVLGQVRVGADAVPVAKTLLLDLGTLGIRLDNLEGMSWGPNIDGAPTLVLVSDNNFSARQVTQFIALRILAQ